LLSKEIDDGYYSIMSSRSTLKDIALQAGVSASTVCRVLRSDPRISKSTSKRVLHVAESLNYRPDPLLTALSYRRRGQSVRKEVTIIAYVTNNRDYALARGGWPSYSLMCLKGAKMRAEQLGYRVEPFVVGEGGITGRRLSSILYARGIQGVCVGPLRSARSRLSLDWAKLSCAAIGYSMQKPALHRAATHHFSGLLLCLQKMRSLGYRRIGVCLNATTSKKVDDLWLAAVLLYARMHPQSHIPLLVSTESGETLKSKFLSWLEQERLQAVVGSQFLLECLEQEAIKVPGSIGYANLLIPGDQGRAAGIDQQTDRVAAAAIDLVIAGIQKNECGIPEYPKTVLVGGKWRDGKTLMKVAGQTAAGVH
jgi:DNA-binding LacI/PurR family transcriptional regulator